jgi:hypothetical protein
MVVRNRLRALLSTCSEFSSPAAGKWKAPYGADDFQCGGRAKKRATFVEKSATGAPGQTGPATFGLGPLC